MKILLFIILIALSPVATGHTKEYTPAFKINASKATAEFQKSLRQEIRAINKKTSLKKHKKIAKNQK